MYWGNIFQIATKFQNITNLDVEVLNIFFLCEAVYYSKMITISELDKMKF